MMVIDSYSEILDFWFAPRNVPKHFESDKEFDAYITKKYEGVYLLARSGELESWKDKPTSLLSLIIVLDQFPRNMFRDKKKMYETDNLAVSLSRLAIEKSYDQKLSDTYKVFLYMPLMHSEKIKDQELSLSLYGKFDDKLTYDFAKRHYDVVLRFGRFPHRNDILGRKSTEEEEEFIKLNPTGF